MRITVEIDDELIADAEAFTGLTDKSALIRAALQTLVQRESARRLASMGGSAPDFQPIPRRRSEPE